MESVSPKSKGLIWNRFIIMSSSARNKNRKEFPLCPGSSSLQVLQALEREVLAQGWMMMFRSQPVAAWDCATTVP